jgi:hypothetical protein
VALVDRADHGEPSVTAPDRVNVPQPPEMPRKPAQRKFAETLVKTFALPSEAADLLSRTVVNPQDARRQLESPVRVRVAGGALTVIYTTVWSPFVSVFPTNARLSEERELPITGARPQFPPLAEPQSEEMTAVMRVAVTSKDHLLAVLERSAQKLLEIQRELRADIREQGVLTAPACAIVRVRHADGRPDAFLVATGDGSTRAAIAHEALGVDADAWTYDGAQADRLLRGLIRRATEIFKRASEGDELKEAEAAFARSLVMPAMLVVGTVGLPIAEAVQSLVGRTHIKPPMSWEPGAKNDAYGTGVIRAFASANVLSDAEIDYFAGMMRLDEAGKYGLPTHADERAALILRRFVDHQSVVARGLKSVAEGTVAKRILMSDVAAEIVIRAYRSTSASDGTHTARVALQRVYRGGAVWSRPWSVTRRSPEEIRASAALEANAGTDLGPSQVELMVLASYYLTKERALIRPERKNAVEPSVIIEAMARTQEGIALLAQAVRDGRDGVAKLRRVREDLTFPQDANGDTQAITDEWLRGKFDPTKDATAPTPIQPITPDGELSLARLTFNTALGKLESAHRDALEVKGEKGTSHVREVGWPKWDADEAIKKLEAIKLSLAVLANVWETKNTNAAEAPEASVGSNAVATSVTSAVDEP